MLVLKHRQSFPNLAISSAVRLSVWKMNALLSRNMSKTILFGVLNWGLGHASRSVPLIQALVKSGFDVVIASDGAALDFLKATFPKLVAEPLPAYKVRYSKGRHQTVKIAQQLPKIAWAIIQEQRAVKQLTKKYCPVGLISDNRLGFWHPGVPSAYLSHQLQFRLVAGSAIANWLHHHFYKRFTEIWIPDLPPPHSLAGGLSAIFDERLTHRHLGPLSRFKASAAIAPRYDLLVVLSGPEPQRTLLENIILQQAPDFEGIICVVRGVFKNLPLKVLPSKNVVVIGHVLAEELQALVATSKLLLMRSGYSSIMDLWALQRGAVLIPTPGQPEQEYLAAHLQGNPAFFVMDQSQLGLPSLPKTLPAPEQLDFSDFQNLFALFDERG